jgi:hypothetical protein
MKKAVKAERTTATIARRLKMPQFMPRAMGESDWP